MNEWKRNDDKIAEWHGRNERAAKKQRESKWQNCQQPVVRFIVKWRHTSHCALPFSPKICVFTPVYVSSHIKCATVAFIVRVRAYRARSPSLWHKREKKYINFYDYYHCVVDELFFEIIVVGFRHSSSHCRGVSPPSSICFNP